MNRKDWIFAILLVFVPISIAWNFLRWDVTIVFLSACLAIVPLAAYMGKATEEIAVVVGPRPGRGFDRGGESDDYRFDYRESAAGNGLIDVFRRLTL